MTGVAAGVAWIAKGGSRKVQLIAESFSGAAGGLVLEQIAKRRVDFRYVFRYGTVPVHRSRDLSLLHGSLRQHFS